MAGMSPPYLPRPVATENDVDMSCSTTGNATANKLDAEAQMNLNAVCEAVKNQVISWGPKAKWKIDLLLLPDGSETAADTLFPTPTNDDSDNLKTISTPYFPSSYSIRGIDVAIQTSDVPERPLPLFEEESLKYLDADDAKKRLVKATERVRRLESLIMSQRREMTDKLEAANDRAEKAASETRVLTRHLQRQERDLEARHDVERRLRESEVRVLSRKLRSLTGARRFAAMSDDEDSEEGRRNRDIDTRVAQAERLYASERRALRKKLRQSETRCAQKEIELDQAREQVTAYMNYAQQLQAHAAQQHHLAQQQHQQHLHSEAHIPGGTQPNGATNSNWVAFSDRKRVRSGLDDLLAAAVEAENTNEPRQGLPNSSLQTQLDAEKATNAPPSTYSTNDSKRISPAVAAANAHVAKAAAVAAALAAKSDIKVENEHNETKRSPFAILSGPHSEKNRRSASVPIPPPLLLPPQPFSGSSNHPFEALSSHTPPATPTTPQKKTRSPYVKWTREEDSILQTAVKSLGCRNWDFVARAVPGRTYHQCRQRWVTVLKNGTIRADEDEDEDEDEDASARTTPSPSPESMTGMPTPSTTGETAYSPRRQPGLFPVGRPPIRATPLPTAQVPTILPPASVFDGDKPRFDSTRPMHHTSEQAMDSSRHDACMESSF